MRACGRGKRNDDDCLSEFVQRVVGQHHTGAGLLNLIPLRRIKRAPPDIIDETYGTGLIVETAEIRVKDEGDRLRAWPPSSFTHNLAYETPHEDYHAGHTIAPERR